MKRSVYNHTRAVTTLLPAAVTATATGTTVDRHGSNLENYRTAKLVVHAGTVTDGTHAIKIQTSVDGTTWADAPAEDVQGDAISLSTSGDGGVFELGYTGPDRYLRAVSTVASATTGGVYGAVFELGDARRTPLPR